MFTGHVTGIADTFLWGELSTLLKQGKPYAPAAFTPGEIPGTHFLEAESTPVNMVPSAAREKIPSDTTGNRSRDRPTSSAVPQPLRYPLPHKHKYTQIFIHIHFLFEATGVQKINIII